METPSPKFVTRLSGELSLLDLVKDGSTMGQNFYKQSLQPLKPTGQPKEGDRNFFTQGFVIGFTFLVLPVIAGTLIGTSYIARKLYRYWG